MIEGSSLTSQGSVEHGLGEDRADVEKEVFDLGQRGAPSRSLGSVELIDEVFGDSLEVGSHFVHLRG